jgi:Flp pilus assembly pilin Flp
VIHRRQRRRGQATVEYMIMISVVSVAVMAVLITFTDLVQNQTTTVSDFLAEELTGNGDDGSQVQ